jgi:hypothetical protein
MAPHDLGMVWHMTALSMQDPKPSDCEMKQHEKMPGILGIEATNRKVQLYARTPHNLSSAEPTSVECAGAKASGAASNANASSCITRPRAVLKIAQPVREADANALPLSPSRSKSTMHTSPRGCSARAVPTPTVSASDQNLGVVSGDGCYMQQLQRSRDAQEAGYHERVKVWYAKLLHYRANPEVLEFIYLILAEPDAVIYRPYDLIVVPHSKVRRDFYYTMSAEGVTNFHGAETSHMSLDAFERAFFLYKQVAKMHFFSRFRLWKAFRLWRAFISRSKARFVCCHLDKRLFHLHPHFGPCLQALVLSCEHLASGTTFVVLSPKQPCGLAQLQV